MSEWLATGRGTSPVQDQEPPAVPVAYAMDEYEAHCLDSLRRLPGSSRRLVCELLEELTSGR